LILNLPVIGTDNPHSAELQISPIAPTILRRPLRNEIDLVFSFVMT
jgi:hypothetical protein